MFASGPGTLSPRFLHDKRARISAALAGCLRLRRIDEKKVLLDGHAWLCPRSSLGSLLLTLHPFPQCKTSDMPYWSSISGRVDDGGPQLGTTGGRLRTVTRPKFPNRCSVATILICTIAGMALACGCSVSRGATRELGGAQDVKLSRTRFGLDCRSELGVTGCLLPMLALRMHMYGRIAYLWSVYGSQDGRRRLPEVGKRSRDVGVYVL